MKTYHYLSPPNRRRRQAIWIYIAACVVVLIGSRFVSAEEDLVGFTEPYQTVKVAALESGSIASIAVKEGEKISKNDLLGVLYHDSLLVSLKIALKGSEAKGAFDAATAETKLRRTILEKLHELQSRGAASMEELSRAQAELEVAEAHLLTAEETIEIRKLEYQRVKAEIEQRMIRSPIDGVVLEVFKKPGEFTSPPNPEVFTIVQLDPLLAIFSVESNLVKSWKQNQKVEVRFGDSAATSGTIEYISPVTDAESGTVRIKVRIENPDQKFRSGERCVLLP